MRLSLLEMLGLAVRGTSIRKMRRALGLVEQHQLDISKPDLEVHLLAGGDLERVLVATAAVRDAGHGNKFRELAAADLEGEDLVQFAARGFVSEKALRRRELEQRAASDPSAREELRALVQSELDTVGKQLDDLQAVPGLTPDARERLTGPLRELQARFRDRLASLDRHSSGHGTA